VRSVNIVDPKKYCAELHAVPSCCSDCHYYGVVGAVVAVCGILREERSDLNFECSLDAPSGTSSTADLLMIISFCSRRCSLRGPNNGPL